MGSLLAFGGERFVAALASDEEREITPSTRRELRRSASPAAATRRHRRSRRASAAIYGSSRIKRAVTMRPFGRDGVAVEAAMVV
jgi:hypothetical protein